MNHPIYGLLRTEDYDTLSRIVQNRWGITPTLESLRWLRQIIVASPKLGVGGTEDSPWSESTWLMWIKNRLGDFTADPGCAEDPAGPYGHPFDVELNPTSVAAWRSFLERYSRELLSDEDLDLWAPVPAEARDAGWMGFAPADELAIQAAESRLGRQLPPSLGCFYSVSNGWRATGHNIYDVLPVEAIGWLPDREPSLHEMTIEAEAAEGPFRDDPGDARLNQYRDEQGTRPRRSLVITSAGNNGDLWVLDPGVEPHEGEWPAGRWGETGWRWGPGNYAELMAEELRRFHAARSG